MQIDLGRCLIASALLGEEFEVTLASLVTGTLQTLQGLLTGLGGATADNATLLVVLQMLAGQTTGSVVGSTVHDFSASADGASSTTLHDHTLWFRGISRSDGDGGSGLHLETTAHVLTALTAVLASLTAVLTALTTLHHVHHVHFLQSGEKKRTGFCV